jgi:all-trans-retinol 13,14-reductase
MSTTNYDVIVIGSGLGGLSCAAILSKLFNKKVLVLEQHYKLGGFTHDFSRKNYHWDVGVHYVGDVSKGSFSGGVFKYITEDRLQWQTIPEPYDTHVFPDLKLEIGQGYENYAKCLIAVYPDQESNIKQYIEDIKAVVDWQNRYNKSLILPPFLYPVSDFVRTKNEDLALMTTKDYLDKTFTNDEIKGALVSSWGNYGILPKDSAFFIHCMNVVHFFHGANYPVGGAGNIAKSIVPTIEKSGGKCLVNHRVLEIIVENGKATGVRANYMKNRLKPETDEEKVFTADTIISDAGVFNTYVKFLAKAAENNTKLTQYKSEIENFPVGRAHMNLFLGLKGDLSTIGLKGGNLWISDNYDHDQVDSESSQVLDGKIQTAFMSSPSMRDKDSKGITAEIITFVDIKEFEKWSNTQHNKRPEDYEAMKEKVAKAMIEYVEKYYPGFKDLVDFYELSSPLTTVHFNNANAGSMYGLAAIPERYKTRWARPYSPIKNVFLTGADIAAHSVAGVVSGGLLTAGVSQGLFSFNKILKALDLN